MKSSALGESPGEKATGILARRKATCRSNGPQARDWLSQQLPSSFVWLTQYVVTRVFRGGVKARFFLFSGYGRRGLAARC